MRHQVEMTLAAAMNRILSATAIAIALMSQTQAQSPPVAEGAVYDPPIAEGAAMPPPQYDHPYSGKLTIQLVNTQEDVRQMCSNNVYPSIACAITQGDACTIIRLRSKDIEDLGWNVKMVERHEVGHCNGWPADHKGARHTGDERPLNVTHFGAWMQGMLEAFQDAMNDPRVQKYQRCLDAGGKKPACKQKALK
jgi:hypothetical protein